MTKVEVDSRLCGFKTLITTEKAGKEVQARIESDCRNISALAEKLGPLTVKDLFHFGSKIYTCAGECHLHAPCLVPCGLINAAQIELQMISKGLAIKEKEISIRFVE